MGAGTVLEGLWEDVARQDEKLRGRYVRVEVIEAVERHETPLPNYMTMTPEENAQAIRDWGYNRPQRSGSPLSEEAVSRESIYLGE